MKTIVQNRHLVPALLITCWLFHYGFATAGEAGRPALKPSEMGTAVAAAEQQQPSQAIIIELKFNEFFKLPIGPRGLEPSRKLQSMVGRRVRMVGYMARQETPVVDFFVLSPLPISLGDADESLADDLPASVIFVHVKSPGNKPLPFFPGLLRVTGILSLGAYEETDGHVSSVRLQLDPELTQAMAAGH